MDKDSCCCSPEEFAQFQDSSDESERLDHFQDQMYCCFCRGMQLRRDGQRTLLLVHMVIVSG